MMDLAQIRAQAREDFNKAVHEDGTTDLTFGEALKLADQGGFERCFYSLEVGVDHNTVRRWFNGISHPSLNIPTRILKAIREELNKPESYYVYR